MEREKQTRIAKLNRMKGASETTRRRMVQANAEADWTATCRRCGVTVTGKLADLYKGCPNCKEDSHA